jgi:CheY-like chemotaxis protein
MTEKNIELSVALPESLCVLDVDPTRFVQVLSNLLHNATKFTANGGTIRVAGHVSGAESNPPGELTLSVSDSGAGISREFLPRVFELFSQGDGASSQPGLGIGLALARRLLEMHGGAIDVRSEGRGRGSEFIIRIPLSTRTPHAPPTDGCGSHGIDCRVVVIDDNRDAAEVMAMLVQELGGECSAAYDGESGRQEVLTRRPDIVLLDIGMPGVDGYNTCRHIRSELGNEVLIVAVTGYGQAHDKEAAARAGFDAHLTKPADSGALAKLLTQRGSSRTHQRMPSRPA